MPCLRQPKPHHKLPSQSWFLWNIKPLWTSWYIQPQHYFFLPQTNLHSQIQTTTFFIQKSSYQTEKKQNKKISQSSCCKLSFHCWQKEGVWKSDVVIDTESWLKPKHFDNEIFSPDKGYTPFRRDRVGQNGGGVFIAVRNDIVVQEMKDIQSDCEDVWIKNVVLGSKSLLIGGILQTPWTWPT